METYQRVKETIFLKPEKESEVSVHCITSCDVSRYKRTYDGLKEENISGDSTFARSVVCRLNLEMLERFIQVSFRHNSKRS